MEKKVYIAPSIEIIELVEPIMYDITSHMIDGKVDGEDDTNWGFGGDGKSSDSPEAGLYNWDDDID